MPTEQTAEATRKAQSIYEERLRGQFERDHWGQFVAINPETGDCFAGVTLSEAVQAARREHPELLPIVLRVGDDMAVELGAMPC